MLCLEKNLMDISPSDEMRYEQQIKRIGNEGVIYNISPNPI